MHDGREKKEDERRQSYGGERRHNAVLQKPHFSITSRHSTARTGKGCKGSEHFFKILPRVGLLARGDLLGRSGNDERTAAAAPLGAEVEEEVRALDDI